MNTLAIAFPILPDKIEDAHAFVAEVQARPDEMAESFARIGIHREEWFVQQSPQGSLMIVWMKAEDPTAAMNNWAASNHPFDCWFKGRAGSVSGIDFNQQLPALPEKVYSYTG